MASTVNIRTYRPQQLSVRESQRAVPHLRIAWVANSDGC